MEFKIRFPSLIVEPNLDEIDPKRLLVYQIDIRCMTTKDFEVYLDEYYSNQNTIDYVIKKYELTNPTEEQISVVISESKEEELSEFRTLCYDLIDYKTLDNVYSMALEKELWLKYKNALKWGSLFGINHLLIGNKTNAVVNFMLLMLLALYSYNFYTFDVVSTGLALAFTLAVLYIVTRTVWFIWLTNRFNVGEILTSSMKSRFSWGIANSVFTLDTVILVVSLILFAIV